MKQHEHDFEDCGYDEQQCDNACRAQSHLCSVCKKSRSDVAQEPAGVKQYVDESAEKIAQDIQNALNWPTLKSTVEALKACAQRLDWLTREQLVEMAVSKERRS